MDRTKALQMRIYNPSNAATCGGDSGGPATLNIAGSEAIGGISSYSTSLTDSNGACYVKSGALSGFVDLNSPSSTSFLSRFPAIKRIAEPPVNIKPDSSGSQGDSITPSEVATLKKELRKNYLTGKKIMRLTTLSAISQRAAALGDEVSFLAQGAPSRVKRTISKAGSSFELASKQRSRAAAVQKLGAGMNHRNISLCSSLSKRKSYHNVGGISPGRHSLGPLYEADCFRGGWLKKLGN